MLKKERKKYGQFFISVEAARFMAGLYYISENMNAVKVLDVGAGSGILACAFVECWETLDLLKIVQKRK